MIRFLLAAGMVVLVCACGSSDPVASGGEGPDDPTSPAPPDLPPEASTFLNVVPPGSNGNSNGNIQGVGMVENFSDQLTLYEGLAFAPEGLSDQPCAPPVDIDAHQAVPDDQRTDACAHYKNAGLTPDRVDEEVTLTNPLTDGSVMIQRDGWGVPFVYADERADAMFGVGYASAQDRLFLHDALRRIGRGKLSEYLGPAGAFFAFDRDIAGVAAYTDDELEIMVERARQQFGELGELMIRDIDNMVAGINAYIDSLTTGGNLAEIPQEYNTIALPNLLTFPPEPWTRNDIVASAVLIQSIFAVGGGAEAQNLLQLQTSDASFGPGTTQIPQAACELWRDTRHADDPATPSTGETRVDTQSMPNVTEACPQPVPAGAAIWDVGSYQPREILRITDTNVPVDLTSILDDLPAIGPVLEGALDGLPDIPGTEGLFGNPNEKITPVVAALQRVRQATDFDGNPPIAPNVTPPLRPATEVMTASLDPANAARESLCAVGLCLPAQMSNFIGVTGENTESGVPIGVIGPQAAYFVAELLWEVAVVSGGDDPGPLDFAGRGVVFGDLPYINIGRGLDYSWSATSGASDLVDTRVSRLCNTDGSPPSRTDGDGDGFLDADGYIYDGNCVPLDIRLDAWSASPTVASLASGGDMTVQNVDRFVMRTHYGPVEATATVNGEPVAISRQRSTYFGELDTAPAFALASTRGIDGFERFRRVFNSVTGSFNWIYLDRDDLGWFHAGLYPKRHPQQHAELPVWGDGRFEWADMTDLPDGFFETRPYPNTATAMSVGDSELDGFFEWPGYLSTDEHPSGVNPERGYFAQWNNSPAPGWEAADGNGSYGPIHRADILTERLDAFAATQIEPGVRKHTIATMIEIAGDGAYVDLRGQETVSKLIQVIEADGDNGPLAQQTLDDVVALLSTWTDDGSLDWIVGEGTPGLGGYRRDRDNDDAYDQRAAVVLADAWYDAMFDDVIPEITALGSSDFGNLALQGRYNAPGPGGSAYQNGWHEFIDRVVQMALVDAGLLTPPADFTPYRVLACGGAGSTFADCRAALIASLDEALTLLGGVDPATGAVDSSGWDGTALYGETVEVFDAIVHTAVSTGAVPEMHWANRPTFQQAVEIRHRSPRP